MILERRPDDFARRNLLLQITMGMLSTAQTLEELLARHAPAEGGGAGDPDDEGALFVLGLIAFTQRLRATAAAAEPPARAAAPVEERSLEDLLR